MKIHKRCPCCQSPEINHQTAVLMPFIANRIFGWEKATIDNSWDLKDISNGVLTFGCKTCYCKSCNHVFIDMGFDERARNLYKDYRSEYNRQRTMYEPTYRDRADKLKLGYEYLPIIEKYILNYLKSKPEKILDYGGDTGENTPFASSANSIYLVDPSNRPLSTKRIHRSENIRMLQDHDFDLVVCMNVLEHLSYPFPFLDELSEKIKGALFYFEVPYEPVIQEHKYPHRKWTKKRHWHEHVQSYSCESLKSVLTLGGFKVIDIQSQCFPNNGRNEELLTALCKI